MSDFYSAHADHYWADDHPVLELVRARQRAGTPAGAHGDGHRLGLAVEGGGMRGVSSAAMLVALDDLGLSHVFDAVYSCSSGAVNAAYFLGGGPAWYPLTIYFDDLSTKRFVDFRRFFRRGPILNLDYAFDEVMEGIKPLDFAAILANPVSFHVAISLVDDLKAVSVGDFADPKDLKAAVKASCWMPVAVPGTGVFRGQRVLDGGVLTAHPYQSAIEDGCTHVLSLSTKPIRRPAERTPRSKRFSAALMDRLRSGLGKRYLEVQDAYRGQRRQLHRWMTEPEAEPYVLDLAPLPWIGEVSRYELRPDRIVAAARHAHAVMSAAVQGVSAAEIREGRFASVPRLVAVRKDARGRLA